MATTDTEIVHDGPAFGGSEYIDPRMGIAPNREIVESLTTDRLEGRRALAEAARTHYRTLVETRETYRAYGAARDHEGDYIAAWIAWAEHGNDGPPPPHQQVVERLADQRENGTPAQRRAVTRYFTPDGTPRLRPAPIGRDGIRGGTAFTHYGDHSYFAPSGRPTYSGGDRVHRYAKRLWDGTLKTDEQARRQRVSLADDIARGHDRVMPSSRGYSCGGPTRSY